MAESQNFSHSERILTAYTYCKKEKNVLYLRA